MTNRNPGISPKHTLSSGVGVIWGMDAAEDECKCGEGSLFGDDDGKSIGVDAPQAATGDAAAEELYNAWPEDIAEDNDSTQEVDGQEAPMKLPTNPRTSLPRKEVTTRRVCRTGRGALYASKPAPEKTSIIGKSKRSASWGCRSS